METSQDRPDKPIVDIVFLVDATGSMQPLINALKNHISVFTDGLASAALNGHDLVDDWRARIVGYRDIQDDASNWYEEYPFVRDVDLLKAQLGRLCSRGGGDEPESLLDALYKLATTPQTEQNEPEDPAKWRCKKRVTRAVIVFTDASYHPTMSIPEARGGVLFDEVKNVIENGQINLSIRAPDLPCYMMLSSLDRAEYLRLSDSQGRLITMDEFIRDKENFQQYLRELARSVTKSALMLVHGLF